MADVIVIGCGASGLAAMRRLYDAGLKVVGLEAADRIGGRIYSVDFGECAVDLGAAWCMGEKHNAVFDLANPLGLIGTSDPDDNWFVLSNGDLLPKDQGKSFVNAINEELDNADKDNARSVSEYLRDVAKSNATLVKDPQLSTSFISWFERYIHSGYQGDNRNAKSLRSLVEYWGKWDYCLNWKGKGYRQILDVLLNKYPDPSNEIPVEILLNKEVETIDWSTEGRVKVTCKDGSSYAAKSAIVTVSVGVLKERHNDLFTPSLPAEKVNTITNLHLSILGKIYIEFTKPWWPKTPAKFTILWRDVDRANFTPDEKWITEIYALQTIDYQPNVLMAWTCGVGAVMMEKVSLDGIKAGINKILDVLFGKEFDVTPVKNIIRTQWASNPLIRCAYAYRSVTTEEMGASAVTLSEPLYDATGYPVLCFGGEATSHHRHTSADGAVEAGFREADRLIESFKNKKLE